MDATNLEIALVHLHDACSCLERYHEREYNKALVDAHTDAMSAKLRVKAILLKLKQAPQI
jgi:hypothetical protein